MRRARSKWRLLAGNLHARNKRVNHFAEVAFLQKTNCAEGAPDSVVAKFATTAADDKRYQVNYYNLQAIISLGPT